MADETRQQDPHEEPEGGGDQASSSPISRETVETAAKGAALGAAAGAAVGAGAAVARDVISGGEGAEPDEAGEPEDEE